MPPQTSRAPGLLETMNDKEARDLPYPQLYEKLLEEVAEAAEELVGQRKEFMQEREAAKLRALEAQKIMEEHLAKLSALEKLAAQLLANLSRLKEELEKVGQAVIQFQKEQMQSEAKLARLNALKRELEAKLKALDEPKRKVEAIKVDLEQTKQLLAQLMQDLEAQREAKGKNMDMLYTAKNELMQRKLELQDLKGRKKSIQEQRNMAKGRRQELATMLEKARRDKEQMEERKRQASKKGWFRGLFSAVVSFFCPPFAIAAYAIGVISSVFGQNVGSRIQSYDSLISELAGALQIVDAEMQSLDVNEKQTNEAIQSTEQEISSTEEQVRDLQDKVSECERSIQELNTRNTTLSEKKGQLEGEMIQTEQEIEAARLQFTEELSQASIQYDEEQKHLESIKDQLAQAEEQKAQLEKGVEQKHRELVKTNHEVAIEKKACKDAEQQKRIHDKYLGSMNEKYSELEQAKKEAEELQRKAVSSLRTPEEAEKALPGIQADVRDFRQNHREFVKSLYEEHKEELGELIGNADVELEFKEKTKHQRQAARA